MEHPDPEKHWRHRRRMAYWSMAVLTTALVLAMAGYIPEPMIELVQGLCWVFGAIVLGYYGNNAMESFAKARGGGNGP